VNQNPVPYLISEAIFSNLGGTATMIGQLPPETERRGGVGGAERRSLRPFTGNSGNTGITGNAFCREYAFYREL
jgi:hypothetical protein